MKRLFQLAHRIIDRVSRFGLAVVTRIALVKLAGMLNPRLALPAGYQVAPEPCVLSLVVVVADWRSSPDALRAIPEHLSSLLDESWELCFWLDADTRNTPAANVVLQMHGTDPRVKVIATPVSVPHAVAKQWVIEQATGLFLGVVEQSTPLLSKILGHLSSLSDTADYVRDDKSVQGWRALAKDEVATTEQTVMAVARKSNLLA